MYRLALDIGTNSLGWACLKLEEYKDRDGKKRLYPTGFLEKEGLPGGGVLIFSDGGRDPKTLKPKNVQRREHRSKRRNNLSRRRRLSKLRRCLLQVPICNSQNVECFQGHRKPVGPEAPKPPGIYESRFKASYQLLESFEEFAAVLLHIAAHRQFESTALSDEEEEDHEQDADNLKKQIKERIAKHNTETGETRPETLGGYLCLLLRDQQALPRSERQGVGIRQVSKVRAAPAKKESGEESKQEVQASTSQERPPRADRKWIRREFQLIKAKQEPHFKHFSEEEQLQIEDWVLEQRVLQPVEPGPCRFFPDKKRARASLPSVIYWRLLQTCNNLRICFPPSHSEPKRALSLEERDLLVSKLLRQKSASLPSLRKELKLPRGCRFAEELSSENASKVLGNTLLDLSKKDYLGQQWSDFPLETQDRIVEQLLKLRTQVSAKREGFNRREAQKLVEAEFADLALKAPAEGGLGFLADGEEPEMTEDRMGNIKRFALYKFPTDHVHVCLDVIRKTTRLLKENPALDMTSAIAQAGIREPGPKTTDLLLSKLPYYGKLLKTHVLQVPEKNRKDSDFASQHGRVPNVTVHVALNQLRKLVNALIDQHGSPTQIFVEMNRDVAKNSLERSEIRNKQEKGRVENEKQIVEINEMLNGEMSDCDKREINRRLRRFKLWKLQDEKDIYNGKPIPFSALFGPSYQIDHIIPRSHGGVDKPWNMLLTSTVTNQEKGDSLPLEFFGERWEGIKKRLGELAQKGKNKKLLYIKRFEEEGVSNDFLPRRGPEAAWINKLALTYLGHICKDTWASTGYLTAALRIVFGIRKKREDLRNHFLDAVMVGFSDRRIVQNFRKWRGQSQSSEAAQRWILPHWKEPYQEIMKNHDTICPAHTQRAALSPPERLNPGGLHNDSHYARWYAVPREGTSGGKKQPPFCELPWKRQEEPSETPGLMSCLTQRQSVLGFFEKNSLKLKDKEAVRKLLQEKIPDQSFRERLLRRILSRLELSDESKPKEVCLEVCQELGVRRIQVLVRGSLVPGSQRQTGYATVLRGPNLKAIVKTSGNDRLEFSFDGKGKPQAEVITMLDAVRTKTFRDRPMEQVLSFKIGDYVRAERKGKNSYWFVKMLNYSNKSILLWPVHLATTNKKNFEKQKKLFQETWGCASRDGWRVSCEAINKQKLYPQKINILGQIKPFSGSFSWSSKS